MDGVVSHTVIRYSTTTVAGKRGNFWHNYNDWTIITWCLWKSQCGKDFFSGAKL